VDHVSAVELVALGLIAFLAGGLNAVAGGGTLLTFPALVAAGLPVVSANVTNAVALVPGYAGGIGGYRRELDGQSATIRRLLPIAVLGGSVGAVLLLVTSTRAFRVIVPILVLGASLLLLAQPRLQGRLQRPHPRTGAPQSGDRRVLVDVGVFLGYFGGVLGVVLLATLGIAMTDHLQRLNALKNVLQFSINGVAVLVFAVFGPVQWWLVLAMAPLTTLGGWSGSRAARRLEPEILRRTVGVFGIVCAVVLAVRLR
jgi:uncharacterized membrane protein YfcA